MELVLIMIHWLLLRMFLVLILLLWISYQIRHKRAGQTSCQWWLCRRNNWWYTWLCWWCGMDGLELRSIDGTSLSIDEGLEFGVNDNARLDMLVGWLLGSPPDDLELGKFDGNSHTRHRQWVWARCHEGATLGKVGGRSLCDAVDVSDGKAEGNTTWWRQTLLIMDSLMEFRMVLSLVPNMDAYYYASSYFPWVYISYISLCFSWNAIARCWLSYISFSQQGLCYYYWRWHLHQRMYRSSVSKCNGSQYI